MNHIRYLQSIYILQQIVHTCTDSCSNSRTVKPPMHSSVVVVVVVVAFFIDLKVVVVARSLEMFDMFERFLML